MVGHWREQLCFGYISVWALVRPNRVAAFLPLFSMQNRRVPSDFDGEFSGIDELSASPGSSAAFVRATESKRRARNSRVLTIAMLALMRRAASDVDDLVQEAIDPSRRVPFL
jgi:hypothetical protein